MFNYANKAVVKMEAKKGSSHSHIVLESIDDFSPHDSENIWTRSSVEIYS